MIKENNSLLELKIETEKSLIIIIYKNFFESLYELFEIILLDPIENFYFEIISLFICHLQIIMFIFNITVSIN